jgi:hypothetical protein
MSKPDDEEAELAALNSMSEESRRARVSPPQPPPRSPGGPVLLPAPGYPGVMPPARHMDQNNQAASFPITDEEAAVSEFGGDVPGEAPVGPERMGERNDPPMSPEQAEWEARRRARR